MDDETLRALNGLLQKVTEEAMASSARLRVLEAAMGALIGAQLERNPGLGEFLSESRDDEIDEIRATLFSPELRKQGAQASSEVFEKYQKRFNRRITAARSDLRQRPDRN